MPLPPARNTTGLTQRLHLAQQLHQAGRLQQAQAIYQDILRANPRHPDAIHYLGLLALQSGRPDEGIKRIEQAVSLSYPEAHIARGNVLRDLCRPVEAQESFSRSATLNLASADAHDGCGSALRDLGRHQEAVASHSRAIALRPDCAIAWYNRGNAHASMNRMEAALADYGRAVALRPSHGEAWHARGLALTALRRDREALASYRAARRLDPAIPWLQGATAFSRRRICDWTDDAEDIVALEHRLSQDEPVAAPFIVAALCGSAALQRKAAEIFARRTLPPPAPVSNPCPRPHRKIRLAYISADFREHPMMHLMAGLFATHDRDRFELHAISLGPDFAAPCMQRIRPHFDHFITAEAMTDDQIAALARERGIDIAIDLLGYTTGHRTGIFQRRPAPVQVNWLGYPGTMSIDCIDYIIADGTLIPPHAEPAYAEKIVFLPDTYQSNDRRRAIDNRTPTRAEQHLPDNAFVFCCFNNSYKITPETFADWMRILHRVEPGVLWLLQDNPDAIESLRAAAARHGIAPARLVFAERLPLAQHLARHRLADLFLDTLPYNAHTTASAALWAELPVLTRIGDSFAGRVAASLLHTINLPDLITTTRQEYEFLAISLATDPARLAAICSRLQANRLSTPLFDTVRFTRHLEAAYETMHQRARTGQPPASFHVPALRDPPTVHTNLGGGPDARPNQNL